jgi:hypothetical protein
VNARWQPEGSYRDFLLDDAVASQLRFNSSYSEHYVDGIVSLLRNRRQDHPVDLAGHGTHLTGIVLQLAPHANLYVARVLQDNVTYDAGAAARRVALVSRYSPSPLPIFLQDIRLTFLQGHIVCCSRVGSKSHQSFYWV